MAGARYIEYVEAGAQNGPPKEVYAQIERDFGQVADPIRLHSPVPRVLTGAWAALRETLLAGSVPRAVKEAVAVAVSQTNACSYCADAHGMMLEAAGHRNAGDAIRRGDVASIADARVRDAARWALETRKPGSELLKKPPFSAADLPEIAGTAVVFHYVNRMVSVFLPPSPFP
ncbi:MAG: carboxymuconolactone decarboxylase family protein, partial [Candidatus Methylomirabilis sp.]|nr:carboxymuconolactone decarboxylase family protein [Deltaproteobacteria bacterium]